MNLIDEIKSSVAPRNWSDSTSVQLIQLGKYDADYQEASRYMSVSLHTIDIKKIARVENLYLYGCFKLHEEESKVKYGYSSSVKTLLHDTAEENVMSIATYNFDWRRARRCKYGHGVSFSNSADYAIKYSNQSNGSNRAMIISDVVVGSSCQTRQAYQYPPDGYDTTTANDGKVIVKYRDDEFYPKFVVYYNLVKRHYDLNRKGQRV